MLDVFSSFLIRWQVNSVCSFDSDQLPHCLALASENTLTIGTIDDIQKLHIQVKDLRQSLRDCCAVVRSYVQWCVSLSLLPLHPTWKRDTIYLYMFGMHFFLVSDNGQAA